VTERQAQALVAGGAGHCRREWGIVPFWAKDPKAISTPFNARSEEAYTKPMFRGPFKSKRCLAFGREPPDR
jgi:putative SOS response-associated peptidase YedK